MPLLESYLESEEDYAGSGEQTYEEADWHQDQARSKQHQGAKANPVLYPEYIDYAEHMYIVKS